MKKIAATLILLFNVAFAAVGADPICGRWQVNGGGAMFDIVAAPGASGDLEMRWIDGPDLSISPGTVVALLVPGGREGVYDCTASRDPRRGDISKAKTVHFVVRLDDDTADAIEFEAYERKRRISLWRWLPYMFRITVGAEPSRPSGLDGATRVTDYPSYIVI